MSERNIKIFLDNTARTIIGEVVEENKTQLKVKNPIMIFLNQNQQQQQMQVQLIPLFFAELLNPESRENGTIWTYNKSSITEAELDLDPRLVTQYDGVNSAQINALKDAEGNQSPAGTTADAEGGKEPEVISLFDD